MMIKDFSGGVVLEPGFYRMTDAVYRTQTQCINATTSKVIIEKSPLHAKQLLEEEEPEDQTKFDIGLVAHVLKLQQGRAIVEIAALDYRTKAAQEARKAALAEGLLPILAHQYERVQKMVDACDDYLSDIEPEPFSNGYAEVAIFAQLDGTWLRALVDWLHSDGLTIDDYKTTESAAPDAMERLLYSHGWDVQAAMHERILNLIDPDNAGRRKHRFVVQETKPPYVTTVGIMSEEALTMGRKRLNYAINLWRQCLATDTWPAYPSPVMLGYPRWGETQWLEREVREGVVPPDVLKGG